MFKKFVFCSLLIVIVFIASSCGVGNGSEYLGSWENVDANDANFVDVLSFTIMERGDHFVFELYHYGNASAQYPATYEDGYFKIQMPGYTWSAFYDDGTGQMIMNGVHSRRVN